MGLLFAKASLSVYVQIMHFINNRDGEKRRMHWKTCCITLCDITDFLPSKRKDA